MATSSASPATSYQSWHAHQFLLARELCPDPAMLLGDHRTQYYSASSVVQRLQLERRLESHHGCVNCINFSHGGELLASGSDDLHIVLWDWRKGVPMSRFETGHHSNIFQAKFVPQCNDSVIVSAARDGQVMCHVISTTGEPITSKQVGLHRDSAHKIALEPDNPHVFLSCGEDGSVLEIDLRDNASSRNKLLICRNDRNGRVPLYSIFIDPSDYNRFAISGRDPFARVYDRRTLGGETTTSEGNAITPQPVQKYCPEHLSAPRGSPNSSFSSSNVTCLVYSHDGKELLCTYNDEDIYTFDTTCCQSDSNNIKRFSGHRNNATVKGVNYFGLCSEYVVSGSDCGHVFLWDKSSQEIVQYFEGDKEGVVNCLEPHPQIPVLATSGLDHDVKIFTPSSRVRTDLAGLSNVTSANLDNRRIDAERMPDSYDMIMSYIMRQYRRRLRRLTDEDEEDDSDSDDSGSRMELRGNGADEDGDEDEDDDGEHYVQCRQS